MGKLCILTNCLDLYFFVDTFCDGAEHGSLHRKVRNILQNLVFCFEELFKKCNNTLILNRGWSSQISVMKHCQVSRVLGELLADHWGEMICQQNSATVSSRYTQLFQVTTLRWPYYHREVVCTSPRPTINHIVNNQDGIMPTPGQLTNRPTSGTDKLQQVKSSRAVIRVQLTCRIFWTLMLSHSARSSG